MNVRSVAKVVGKVALAGGVVAGLALAGGAAWVKVTSDAKLAATYEVHEVEFRGNEKTQHAHNLILHYVMMR